MSDANRATRCSVPPAARPSGVLPALWFSNDPAERFCGAGRTMAAHIPVTTSVWYGSPRRTPQCTWLPKFGPPAGGDGERKYVTVLVVGFDGAGLHRVAALWQSTTSSTRASPR
jgi:hypothetical protein